MCRIVAVTMLLLFVSPAAQADIFAVGADKAVWKLPPPGAFGAAAKPVKAFDAAKVKGSIVDVVYLQNLFFFLTDKGDIWSGETQGKKAGKVRRRTKSKKYRLVDLEVADGTLYSLTEGGEVNRIVVNAKGQMRQTRALKPQKTVGLRRAGGFHVAGGRAFILDGSSKPPGRGGLFSADTAATHAERSNIMRWQCMLGNKAAKKCMTALRDIGADAKHVYVFACKTAKGQTKARVYKLPRGGWLGPLGPRNGVAWSFDGPGGTIDCDVQSSVFQRNVFTFATAKQVWSLNLAKKGTQAVRQVHGKGATAVMVIGR